MGFFDKLKDTASVVANKAKETGSAIGDASKTAIEKQKIKSAINKENSNINKQYTEIGKKYVELFGNQPSAEFGEYISNINTSRDEISKLTIQLNALDDYVVCSCGAKVPKNASFCPTCGSVITVAETTAQDTEEQSYQAETNTEVVTDTTTITEDSNIDENELF